MAMKSLLAACHCLVHLVLLCPALASFLYVAHYNGNVYSLALEQNTTSGRYGFGITSSSTACGSLPSWLTYDSASRTLYCSGESGSGGISGTLTALYAENNGKLTTMAETALVGPAASTVIYSDGGGSQQYLAMAHS